MRTALQSQAPAHLPQHNSKLFDGSLLEKIWNLSNIETNRIKAEAVPPSCLPRRGLLHVIVYLMNVITQILYGSYITTKTITV